jgi:ABC-type arginine/histidine transport system permease subunit
VYSSNYAFFELLSVACVWYLAMTTVATFVQAKLEARAGFSSSVIRRSGLFGITISGIRRG